MIRVLLIVTILASYGCGSFMSPHENFKSHMSSVVGEKISTPSNWAQKDRLVSISFLRNGNEEYKYRFRDTCFYFFEVKKNTEVVVGWRFEGSEDDCVINP